MLRWRLIIGTGLVVVLLGLCWLDEHSGRPGVYLFPLAVILCVLATEELLALFRKNGSEPYRWTSHLATLSPILTSSIPICWPQLTTDSPLATLGLLAVGLVVGLLVSIVTEMLRYSAPGKTLANLAAGAFGVLYLGGLLGFLVQLRHLPVGGNVASGGMWALFSMIAVVKFTDIGAYFAGRRWGKRKLAPILSPGKTWEGAAGGLVLAVVAALVTLGPVARLMNIPSSREWGAWLFGAVAYGLTVSLASMVGDLAESLIKRDAGVKDSSTWLPGFGGVLDLLDSLLVAAPVAYLFWVSGLVGP